MNTYSIQFHCNCPVNGIRIGYRLRIETTEVVPVEQIVAVIEAVESGEPAYHEELADQLASRFPGKHTMAAHHHGVDVETIRTGNSDA